MSQDRQDTRSPAISLRSDGDWVRHRVRHRGGIPRRPASLAEGLWSNLKAVELANLTGPTLAEVIDQAQQGVERVRRTPHLASSFLRHAGRACGGGTGQHVVAGSWSRRTPP